MAGPFSTEPVQSFSAALLCATAVAQVDELTRDNVLAELATITSWTGGGLHYEGNPADNAVGDCYTYFQVQDGKFVRIEPTEAATFTCGARTVSLQGDYGEGARRP